MIRNGGDSMWTREQVKSNGKAAFKHNYGMCVLVSLILLILAGGSGFSMNFNWDSSSQLSTAQAMALGAGGVLSVIGIVVGIFVSGPMEIGGDRFFMENRFHKTGIEKIIYAFTSGSYGNCVLVMFMKSLFTLLWTLLLIVPGIVKNYEYRMIPYLLSENPSMSRERAFSISKQMMNGEKMDAFCLDISFIGWYLLGLLSCGLFTILYVQPYVDATNAELYTALRTKAIAEGIILPEELPGYEE
jgi:uncharacterized membrane protein